MSSAPSLLVVGAMRPIITFVSASRAALLLAFLARRTGVVYLDGLFDSSTCSGLVPCASICIHPSISSIRLFTLTAILARLLLRCSRL